MAACAGPTMSMWSECRGHEPRHLGAAQSAVQAPRIVAPAEVATR